jgi:Na+/H+-dicarboxylate symporter
MGRWSGLAGRLSMSATTRVFAALVLGLLAGAAVLAHPAPVLLTMVRLVEPIGTLWVNAIRMTVVPLVVSLLITGVASTGSIGTIRTLGVRAAAAFIGLLAISASIGMIAVPWLFAGLQVDRATTTALRGTAPPAAATASGLGEWITGIVPANPIKAAADGALLPVVVFTLAFALALLTVRAESRRAVVTFFAAVAEAMLAIVRVVIALAPVGVFALMLPVASRTGITAAGALAYYVVATAGALTLGILALYPIVALAARTPPSQFAKAVFPAQVVAAASSSSLASLPALVDGAERRLHLPASATGLVLPLAVSSFKLASPILCRGVSGAALWDRRRAGAAPAAGRHRGADQLQHTGRSTWLATRRDAPHRLDGCARRRRRPADCGRRGAGHVRDAPQRHGRHGSRSDRVPGFGAAIGQRQRARAGSRTRAAP